MELKRSSGILLHPTSLPGKYGIGTLGKEAFIFIDFLIESGQKIWQILPLGPTGFENSPYQCYSSIAGNPLLIDLEELVNQKLLNKQDLEILDIFKFNDDFVNFDDLRNFKYLILRKAYNNFLLQSSDVEQAEFIMFCNQHLKWLDDYCFFMALKSYFDDKPWYKWDDDFKFRKKDSLDFYRHKLKDEIGFQQFMQYLFFRQWSAIYKYANAHEIKIIGDIPLYVAYDSVDVWIHPEIFQLNEDLLPIYVAGVPPDYFSEEGQLWGNPVYNWEALKQSGFTWWIDRIKGNLNLYDILRIDHFRGLSAYWAIPSGEENAINGSWKKAQGKELFETLKKELGDVPIIAEDLGIINSEVEELRDSFGFPGMKIIQFAFDSEEENDYLPHTYIKNCIVYTGTHDNNTISGWWNNTSESNKQLVMDYLDCDEKNICWSLIRAAWASTANIAIVPLQDVLCLGEESRMNHPGTSCNNWKWRFNKVLLTKEVAAKLKKITTLYWR